MHSSQYRTIGLDVLSLCCDCCAADQEWCCFRLFVWSPSKHQGGDEERYSFQTFKLYSVSTKA